VAEQQRAYQYARQECVVHSHFLAQLCYTVHTVYSTSNTEPRAFCIWLPQFVYRMFCREWIIQL